jgi:succinyl-diaminopimelate desuccinylase
MEEILRQLVAFKTVTGNQAECHKLLVYVADYLSARGMYIRWFEHEGYESLVASVKPNKKVFGVMLAAHVDVVGAPARLFKLQKRGGKYIGRGVMDMKCAVAVYMKTVDELQDNLQDYDFGIMLTSDEEIAGTSSINGTVSLINEGYVPKMLILPDGGQDWQMEASSNGYAHFTLTASGKTAHGSRPWEGENAAFKIINTLQEIKEHFKDHGPETDTLNISSIITDGPVNRIPDYAKAEVSIRVVKRDGLGDWVDIFNDICTRHSVKLIMRFGWEPHFNDMDNPYVKRYAELTEEVTGVKVKGFHSYGGSDTRFFADQGVPYASAYPRGGGHHSDHEWLQVEALEQLGTIITRYVQDMADIMLGDKPSEKVAVGK